MGTHSLLTAMGLPEQFGLVLLLLSLGLSLAPYLAGVDLGVIKVPDVGNPSKRVLRLAGPFAFGLAVFLHLPLISEGDGAVGPATTDSLRAVAQPVDASEPKCSVSGMVFDSDTDRPLSAVRIAVFNQPGTPRPTELQSNLATTGPDGSFHFDCGWVESEQFPIWLAMRHSTWVATRITGHQLEGPQEWTGVNIPIAMNSVDLIPLQEIGVSFGSRRTSAGSFIVGHVENRSERAFACVRVTFQLTNSLGGERREAGTIEFEVRNLRSREERPYEERVPEEVGYYLKAKQECS